MKTSSSRTVRLPSGAALADVRIVSDDAREGLDGIVARLVEEAHARGFAAGSADAVAFSSRALDEAACKLDALREASAGEAAGAALALAIEIASGLLHAEVEAGRYDLERIVRDALATGTAGRCVCTVHVHPDDAARLAEVDFRAGVTISADPGVRRGDVHLETEQGLLVRELDSALDAIAERLRGEIE